MKYIVSGYRRSGTSAMVKALSAGLEKNKLYDESYEYKPVVQGYHPNPGGLFEVGQKRYMSAEFLRTKLPDEGVVKIFFDGLVALPADDYTVIFMQRDPAEIARSVKRTEQYFEDVNFVSAAADRKNAPDQRHRPFDIYSPYCQEDIDHVLGICEQRNDMQLHQVQFQDLVITPDKVFRKLVTDSGLPINIIAAVSIINPEYYRSYAPST